VAAVIPESQTGTGNEVAHCARYQHLAVVGLLRHASGDVHGDARNIIRCQLYFASVQPAAHLDAERAHPIDYRGSATHGASRTVERRKNAVAEWR
jgi:hypothetical protein